MILFQKKEVSITTLSELLDERKKLTANKKESFEIIKKATKELWDTHNKEFDPKIKAIDSMIYRERMAGVGKRIKSVKFKR